MTEKHRAYYLTVSEFYRLNLACEVLHKAFETVGVFLVGSCLHKKDYRDVDVRLMMREPAYRQLFPLAPENPQGNALWDLVCVSISDLLSRQTGLPIDFQIQEMGFANKHWLPENGHTRNAIGFVFNHEKSNHIEGDKA